MSEILEDGTGKGYKAEVSKNNQLEVASESTPTVALVSERDELAYVFASGDFITLTSTDTETGIFHVKNDSATMLLYIYSIRSCADVISKWKLYKNSNAGTLITDQTAGQKNNLNIASAKIPEVTVYKGAEGKTLSGGTMLEHWINDVGHSTEVVDGAMILGRDDSVELTVEVPSAGDVCCRIFGYYK